MSVRRFDRKRRWGRYLCRHEVQRPDGAEDGDVAVHAGVALDTDSYNEMCQILRVKEMLVRGETYRGPG